MTIYTYNLSSCSAKLYKPRQVTLLSVRNFWTVPNQCQWHEMHDPSAGGDCQNHTSGFKENRVSSCKEQISYFLKEEEEEGGGGGERRRWNKVRNLQPTLIRNTQCRQHYCYFILATWFSMSKVPNVYTPSTIKWQNSSIEMENRI